MSTAFALPAPLQRWHGWLAWFDPMLAESLGELVRRLQDLAGPAKARSGRSPVEPEGLGDLRSRGPYDRLLTTEWLLADELPEEFLRRAASHEHLFLAPTLRATPTDRAVVALFDAGPLQLGAPRLAHLAAWVLLARRAEELGGSLFWGVVQEPGQLHEASGVRELARLMRARTFVAASDAHRSAWREAIAGMQVSLEVAEDPAAMEAKGPAGTVRDPDASASLRVGAAIAALAAHKRRRECPDLREAELWWIGAPTPALAAPTGQERALSLRLRLMTPELEVAFAAPGVTRRAVLPLPDERISARLLRADFKTPVPALTAPGGVSHARPARRAPPRGNAPLMAMTQAPRFARGGDHLMVPGIDGSHTALVFSVPAADAKRGVQRRTHQWSARQSPVALGVDGLTSFGLMQVAADRDVHQGWHLPDFGGRRLTDLDEFKATPGTAKWMPLVALKHEQQSALLLLDDARQLSFWPSRRTAQEAHLRIVGRQVLAMAASTDDLAIVVSYKQERLWLWEVGLNPPDRGGIAVLDLPEQPDRVFLALRVRPPLEPRWGWLHLPVAVAARVDADTETWRMRWSSEKEDLFFQHKRGELPEATVRAPSGGRVIGLTTVDGEASPSLIVLVGKRALLRVSVNVTEAIFQADADIVQASVCPWSGRVAVITRDRELIVIDGSNGQPLMIARDEKAAEASHGTGASVAGQGSDR